MGKTIEKRAKELAFSSYHESIRGTIKNVYIYAANEQRKIDIEKACEAYSAKTSAVDSILGMKR